MPWRTPKLINQSTLCGLFLSSLAQVEVVTFGSARILVLWCCHLRCAQDTT
uniref:Similar to RAB1B, member RAS oncogene family n=1 Tax=Arundo donax TaxID=35708 RepID=A0A0A9F6V7_ARUDO